MKKYIIYIFIAIAYTVILNQGNYSYGQETLPSTPLTGCPTGQILNLERKCMPSGTYVLLAPINIEGGILEFDPTKTNALNIYLNLMIKLVIGISAVLAVVMIVIGGIEYMTSELVHSKEAGKEKITNALLGLIIALGAYALLYTINPDLLKGDVAIKNITTRLEVTLGGESPDPFRPINRTSLQSLGITNCTGSGGKSAVVGIGQQFIGKTNYSQAAGKRNTVNGSTIVLDCSAFVAQVYNCAGLSYTGGNSNEMFSSGNATAVNGKTYDFSKLNPGDLIGWKPTDDPARNGHVAIYMGNGNILDTQSVGATAVRPLSSIKDRVKYVKWP